MVLIHLVLDESIFDSCEKESVDESCCCLHKSQWETVLFWTIYCCCSSRKGVTGTGARINYRDYKRLGKSDVVDDALANAEAQENLNSREDSSNNNAEKSYAEQLRLGVLLRWFV